MAPRARKTPKQSNPPPSPPDLTNDLPNLVYNYLLTALIGEITTPIHAKSHTEPDSDYSISSPRITQAIKMDYEEDEKRVLMKLTKNNDELQTFHSVHNSTGLHPPNSSVGRASYLSNVNNYHYITTTVNENETEYDKRTCKKQKIQNTNTNTTETLTLIEPSLYPVNADVWGRMPSKDYQVLTRLSVPIVIPRKLLVASQVTLLDRVCEDVTSNANVNTTVSHLQPQSIIQDQSAITTQQQQQHQHHHQHHPTHTYYTTKKDLQCPTCPRRISVSRFAMHLDRCMGVSKGMSSGASGSGRNAGNAMTNGEDGGENGGRGSR